MVGYVTGTYCQPFGFELVHKPVHLYEAASDYRIQNPMYAQDCNIDEANWYINGLL